MPLLCSSVTFSLHHSPAQPKVLLPKLLLFHIALITPDLLFPVRTQRCVHQVHWILVFCKQFHSAVIPGPHGASSAPETFLPLAFVFTSYCLPGPAHATSPAHIHLILFHSTWPHHLQCRLLAWLRRLLTVLLPQEALSKSLPRGQVLPGICQVHGRAGRKISICISFKPLPLLTTLISAVFHWVPT